MKKQQGFTLIEIIVVVVLLAITMGVTSDILITLVRSNTKTQVLNEIEQQANFVSLKIEKELRDAIDATSPYPNQLVFTRRDDKVEVTYTCSDCDSGGNVGKLTRSVDGNAPVDVTIGGNIGGVDVVCSNCFTIEGTNPKVVRLDMDFKESQLNAGLTYSGSTKINSSIVIRSSYK